MFSAQFGEGLRDESERGRLPRADHDRPRKLLGGRGLELALRPFGEVEDLPRAPQEQKRLVRGLDPSRRADEEPAADFVLQLCDLLGERRLGDVQPFGRAGEAAFFRDCEEISENAQFHADSLAVLFYKRQL